MSKELLPAPTSFEGAMQLATTLSKSQLIPKQFQNRPQDIVVAMMWSHTLNIPIVQGLQHIAVINGKPSMYGDGLLAVAMASGQMQDFKEELVGKTEDEMTAICKVTRRGLTSPIVSQFSVKDAKLASLWKKPGPWTNYPKRMLKMRARAFALRDAFPDILSGISSGEEQEDVITVQVTETSATERPAEAPKMPRRKKAVAEEMPQDASDVVETKPTQEEPEQEAEAVVAEQSSDNSEIFERLHKASNRQDLRAIWSSLTVEQQSSAEIIDAFQKRQADISLAEGTAQ